MQKTIVPQESPVPPKPATWIDVEACARVTLTSEDPEHPIESALKEHPGVPGWRAAEPGPQTLWLHFDRPLPIQRIRLCFAAAEHRTQEFALQASTDGGASYREIVRQQFNFSPGGATNEEEDYFPRLSGVTDLKLAIVPDISGGSAYASLRELRLA